MIEDLGVKARVSKTIRVMSLLHNAFATASVCYLCRAWYHMAIRL